MYDDTHEGLRECARGHRCTAATTDPDTGEKSGALGPRAFCPADEANIRRVVADLPTVYAELRELLTTPAQAAPGGKVSFTRAEAPMPLRGDVDEALTDIQATVFAWEARVRTVLGMRPAPEASWARMPERVAAACTLLDHRMATLLGLPMEPMPLQDGTADERGGADAGLDLLEVHRRGDRLARPSRPAVAVPVGCPACASLCLLRTAGEEGARCPGCGRGVTEDEYGALVAEHTANIEEQAA
ncbi:hypothetical protein [Nocardiopsis rhodophaea]|uniref:hypothetical protein n=1 Tax=Nocardiopsis rhodophaea TaxID=280238 RepID=UPI0031E3F35E